MIGKTIKVTQTGRIGTVVSTDVGKRSRELLYYVEFEDDLETRFPFYRYEIEVVSEKL